MAGWIKLHRKIMEWEWYKDSETKSLFLHLLLKACTEPKEYRGLPIARGQLATTLTLLQQETGLTVRSIRTGLKRLTKCQTIDTQSDTRFTIVTIRNYDSYQCQTEESDTESDTKVTREVTRQYNKKKEERIISTSTAPACACTREGDGDGIDTDIKELRGSQVWLEQIMMKHRIFPDELDALFSDFAAECRCNGLKAHIDLNDAKRHFNAWLRILKEKEDGKTNWRDSERNVRDAQREAILRTMQVVAGTAEVDRDVQKPF